MYFFALLNWLLPSWSIGATAGSLSYCRNAPIPIVSGVQLQCCGISFHSICGHEKCSSNLTECLQWKENALSNYYWIGCKIFHLYFEQDIQLERKYSYEGAGLYNFIMLRYVFVKRKSDGKFAHWWEVPNYCAFIFHENFISNKVIDLCKYKTFYIWYFQTSEYIFYLRCVPVLSAIFVWGLWARCPGRSGPPSRAGTGRTLSTPRPALWESAHRTWCSLHRSAARI